MHLAAERGHTATVEFLADKFRASVFDRTKDGSTLMHIAALNGHPDTAMILFKKGVPLLMPNKVRSSTTTTPPWHCRERSHDLFLLSPPLPCRMEPGGSTLRR